MNGSSMTRVPPGGISIRKRAVAAWVLYDLANTIFSMGVVSLFFPLWVRETVGAERADVVWGVILAVSYAIIFVVSPLLGAMTDRARRRMPFLIISTLLCVAFTVFLARSGFVLSAILFVLANVTYQAGLQFYDALLPEVSTPQNRGRIGGIGIGIGYIGSFLAVGMGFLLGTEDKAQLFLFIGVLFLVFALPCFLFVRERGNPNPRPVFGLKMIRESTAETIRALRSGNEYPGLLRFLVGRVFYTDAVNTVIAIMGLYTVNIAVASGLEAVEGERAAQVILLFAIVFAIIGGFVWGVVVDRIGPKRSLDLVLYTWIAVFLAAAAIGIFALPLWALGLVAASAGIALGGMWAADRPYMLRLTPPHRIGEFYGLYGMVGRFSAITGPITWAVVLWITIEWLRMAPHVGQGIGILMLLLEILIAFWILRRVSDARREWKVPASG
ncbi:MAG: MFS transporter [Gemmatimonadota bacterium]